MAVDDLDGMPDGRAPAKNAGRDHGGEPHAEIGPFREDTDDPRAKTGNAYFELEGAIRPADEVCRKPWEKNVHDKIVHVEDADGP